MTIIDLIKQMFSATDEQINSFSEAMKTNSIFTTSHENMDVRYPKLKGEHETVTKQYGEAQKLIEEMKKSTKGQEEAQQKITAYEQQVQHLNQELADEKWRNRARIGLMQAGADDIDYVLYKLEENMTKEGKERKLTDAEEIDGWADLLKNVQTQLPQRFAKADDGEEGYQVFNPNKLKKGDGGEMTVTKERFMAMDFEERLALKTKNEKLYNELSK